MQVPDLGDGPLEIILRTAVVYVALIALLRIGGKRQVGQLSILELVTLLVVSDAVQNAMVGENTAGETLPGPSPESERIMEWLISTHYAGCTYLSVLHEALAGAAQAAIDPSAWQNTLAAMEWAVSEARAGRVQWTKRALTEEDAERVRMEQLSETFSRVTLRFGFMESPNVPKTLAIARRLGWQFDIMSTSFFLSRRALKPAAHSGMPGWQDLLFIRLSRSANDATDYFQIPTGRVVEVGTQVTI